MIFKKSSLGVDANQKKYGQAKVANFTIYHCNHGCKTKWSKLDKMKLIIKDNTNDKLGQNIVKKGLRSTCDWSNNWGLQTLEQDKSYNPMLFYLLALLIGKCSGQKPLFLPHPLNFATLLYSGFFFQENLQSPSSTASFSLTILFTIKCWVGVDDFLSKRGSNH